MTNSPEPKPQPEVTPDRAPIGMPGHRFMKKPFTLEDMGVSNADLTKLVAQAIGNRDRTQAKAKEESAMDPQELAKRRAEERAEANAAESKAIVNEGVSRFKAMLFGTPSDRTAPHNMPRP